MTTTNYTLVERARYAPDTFTQDELIDLLAELEAWRSMEDSQELTSVYDLDLRTPQATINTLETLFERQMTQDQDDALQEFETWHKPFWNDCMEAAGGAHYLTYPDISDDATREHILNLIELGEEAYREQNGGN